MRFNNYKETQIFNELMNAARIHFDNHQILQAIASITENAVKGNIETECYVKDVRYAAKKMREFANYVNGMADGLDEMCDENRNNL